MSDAHAAGFAGGTRIAVERDGAAVEVAAECLVVGDHVRTTSGTLRSITRLGQHQIDIRCHPYPHEAHPVRIVAHAFGNNRPARDLCVAPKQSLCLDILGEVLIPADALINGWTIARVDVDAFTYWRIELDSQDIVFAENQPVESGIGNGDWSSAESEIDVLGASPDADPAGRAPELSRPFHDSGPMVEGVKAQMCRRLPGLGWTLTNDLALHLDVDGCRLDPIIRGLTARFHVPAHAKVVWLVSPTSRPCDTIGTADGRELGLFIAALRIEDGFSAPCDIAIDDALLCVGFHAVEEGPRRWTAGRARLPAVLWEGREDDFFLRLDLAAPPVPRWHRPG